MRNDLGQGSEYVKSITVGGNDMGGECHPDGGDYDCTFSNSCPALKTTVIASATGTASVSMVFTGHSHDCDCKLEHAQINTPDYDNNVCVKENTGDSTYTPMKAAARFTATPVVVARCDAGYGGADCSTALLCKASGSGSGSGFDPAVVQIGGEIPCDLTQGDISGNTGHCKCTCKQGFTGDACNLADFCVAGDGVSAGTIKCSASGGTVRGTTGGCACDCKSGYHGTECSLQLVHKTCTGPWSGACGQGCMHTACTAQGGVWVPLDYRSNPYTCEVSSSSSCPARYSAA